MANEVDYDAPIFEAPDGSLFIKGPDAGEDNFDLKPTGLTLREVQKRAQQRITDAPSLSKAATQFLLGLEEGATVATPRAIGGGLEAASGLLPENYGGAALRKIGREAREGAGQIGKEYEDLSEGVGGGGVAKFARGLGSSVVPSASALLAAAPLGVLGASAGATVTGSAVASGLQSLGGTFADAFEANKKRGMSDEEAYRKSYTPAVLSGLVTGLVTKGFGGTGLEPILLGKAVPKGFAAAVKEVAKDVGMEAVEEATDEAWQAVIRSTTFNPEATTEENLQGIIQAGIAGGLMAGAVRGAQSAPSAVNDLFAGKRPTAPTPPPLPVQPAPVAPVSPATPAAAAPQVSQRVSVPVEPPPMPKISGLMLNQPLSTWSTSPSSPNILAQSPDSFGIGNKVVKLSQAGGGFGKVGTVTAMTGPKVDGNPNATVTVLFDDGTTAVSGFKEFGFLENVQQAKAMSEAARGKPFEFSLPPPSPRVTLPEPPAKVGSKRTVPLDASEQLQQRINTARAAGDAATARKLAIELDMLGAPPVATPKPRRVAITPEAQAAAPKRQQALPQAEPLPEPLEGQPYDTRLETRPEASMPAIPAGELGIERGRVAPVDPDLAAAVEDVRGGYSERVARELAYQEPEPLTSQQRQFAEGLAKKYGAPALPSVPAAEPYEQLSRFSNMLERAADRSKDPSELAAILEAANGATEESRIAWAIIQNPYSSDATYTKAKRNPAVLRMTSQENVDRTDSRRAELRAQRNLAGYSGQAPTNPAQPAPAVAAKEPWEMTRADLIRGLFSEPSTANDFIKRLDEFDSLPAEKQKAFMRDKYPDYAYAGRMTRVTGDGQLQAVLRLAPHRAAVEAALREGKPVPPAVLADYPELVQKATPAAAPKPASNPFDTSASSKRLTELQSSKPRPIVKFFGPSGGTPEQRAAHEAKIRKWNSDYRKALRNHKELVEKSNEWIRSQKETPSTQPPYAPQEQAPVEVLRNQPPGTPAQVAEGKPREVSEAAGEGAPEKRDKSKPEQMDQNEFYAWSKARARRMQDESGSAAPFMQETQQQYFRKAFKESLPINADSYDAALKRDVKRYLKLPEGYIRKGELYVFEKAIPEAAAPTVAAKEPWEMTREEYKKTLGGRTNQMTGEPFYPEGWPLSDEAVVAWRKLVDEDRRLLKAKLPTSKDLLDWKGGTHLAVIQQAISEGKPVPPAVLADYPELKQAAGKAAKQPEPAYISPEEVDTVGKTKSGQPVRREVVETLPSEAAGEGAPEKRDKSKPEQMTPEEYVPDGGSYKEQLAQAKILAASLAAAKKKLIQNVSEGGKKMIRSSRNEKHREAVRQRDRLISMGESGFLKDSHGYYVRTAASKNLPLSAAAVDTYGIKLPPGYIREGDLYVYRPEVKPEEGRGVIPKEGVGSIYQMERGGETKWLVQQGEKRGFGDSIFDTEQEAVAESQREAMRREQRAESLRKLDAEKSAEASAKAEREDLGTFTDGMSPMKRGAVVKQLTAKFRYLGKEMSRRDIIRELVNQGRKVEVEEGQRVLSNDQGEYLGEKVLTKAGLDYAEHLIRERDAQMSLGQTPTARPAPSLSKMQVEQAVRELFDGNTPPNFQVTHNYGKVFNGREVRGWYDPATGTIWLNAAYLRSPQEARAVFVEEAFHAIQNDKAVQKELSRLVASLTPEQLSSAKAAYGNISEEQLRMEAVADILEQQQLTQEQRGTLARLWDAVLGAVQRLYGKFTGKAFTERDAQDVLAKALKAAAVGKRSLKSGGEVYADGGFAAKNRRNSLRLRLTREALTEMALSQASWRDWYSEHQETLDDFFGDHADVFQKILSATSQAATVKANVGLALKAFGQWIRGEQFSGYLPAVIGNLNRIRDEEQLQGQKISAYQSANKGESVVVVDRHIARMLFGVDSPSKAQFEKAQRVLTEIAKEMGWKPEQVQAALWAASIVKSGKTPESYANYLKRLETESAIQSRTGIAPSTGSGGDGAGGGRGRYSGGSQAARGAGVAGGQAMFSTGSPQNQLDQKYFEAIQRGDMQEVQALVDEAARGAGYDSPEVYRGDRIGKTAFTGREDRSNFIQGNVFFSSEPAIAAGYAPNNRRWKQGYVRAKDLQQSDGLYRAKLNISNPLIVDARGEGWDSVPFNGKSIQIDDLAVKARELGHDGLIVKDVVDQYGASDQYVVFNPSQIKSSDPITYDDSGNIIPLSQRFQQESPDIRYSLGEPVKGIANENTGTIRGDDSIGASQEPSQNQQRLRPLYQDQGLQAGASGFSVQNASRVAKDLESSGAVLWGTEPEIEAAYLDANSDAIQAGKPTPPTLTGGQVFRGPVYPGTKATSEGVSGKPRVLITRAAKSLLLLGQSNSDILAHRFLFGADKASNHRDFNLGLFQKLPKLRIVFEPVGAAPLAAYYRSYDTIIVNQAKLDGFDLSNPATAALLDAVISEELIHAAVNRLATNEEILSAWTGLSDMERKTAKDIYGITNPVDGFTDIQFANEYLRLVLQQRLSGKTTEQVVPISSQLKKILQKLVDFLKRSFGNKPENSVARQLVERIEGAIRGNAPIKQPLFPSSGEALATNISQSDATTSQNWKRFISEDGTLNVREFSAALQSGVLDVGPIQSSLMLELSKNLGTEYHPVKIQVVDESSSQTGWQGRFRTFIGKRDGIVEIASKKTNGTTISDSTFILILNHELLHNGITSKLPSADRQLIRKFERLYNFSKEKAEGTEWSGKNPFKNLDEFIAEGLSRKKFREWLAGLDYTNSIELVEGRRESYPDFKPVSVFSRLLELTRQLLGLPVNTLPVSTVSALEQLVSLSGQLLYVRRSSNDYLYAFAPPENISQSDATEVQGRAIEPSLVAAASRAVADLGRQQVEEFEQAGRQLEGLAYESKAFRQARSELNNLVSLHEGRLRQLPQDRVTNDMRANIRDGVSIENGQIVVGDELVAKLAQMGVQARPELVKAMQAEVYFEQQARRLVDNLGKLATLKELKDYYTRIKAPADEIENLNKLIAAKEKVVANLTPVTTNRGRGQQSIGERASEITRANASKVELQSKRDALALEPVQEFFGKGIAELRDLSEKAKAAADLTRALMDSTTSVSELARLGAIYDKWASFDATVKDALVKGTLTDEQRVAVLTDLQKSFHEFDSAKFRMDDLLNSEEKGLLKDIREAEAAIADAKVTSGLADVLVADALKAAKGEMGLTGTVGDTANIANLEASTGAITTLAMNLGRTIDQNRWLYDFLVAPGNMPAFGASVAQSLGISEAALREILKVVQQSPSLASAIVTLTDDAAAKLAASPPLQMQSIAQLATSGNPAAMSLAANLTSQIVQQANAQGTKANAARQAAARQLAQSVVRLRTLQQGQALFNQTANSPAFQQLRQTVSMGASEAQKMVVLGPTGPVLRGFKSAAKEYQPELKIDVQSDALELKKTRDKVWKYLQNAEQYVSDYEAVAAAHAANPANPSPSQLGFDVADYNGLKHAIENQIAPMFLNMGDMDDTARAAQYLTPVGVRKFMKLPAFLGQIFNQYEQLGKMVGGFAGNTFRQQIAKYKRGYLNAKGVASQFQDLPKLQSAAMQSHNIRSEDTYRRIFNEVAHYGRLFGTPLRVGFTLPVSNQVVTKADMEFLKRTLAFEEKLRREVTEIDPVTGVRYMRGGKEITRKGAYTGDLGMPRHMNRGATQFIADVTNAYAGTTKGFTPTTDLSASTQDEAVKYWNEHLGTLKQHILDSLRTDRSFKQSAEMAAAEKRIAARWLAGNMNQVNSVQDLVDLIAAEIPTTSGKNPLDTAREGLNNELLQYVAHAERIQKERAEDNAKTSGLSIALSSENEYTKPAAYLELPSEYYDYGAVSSIDRITAQARANHSSLIDFANSIRLAITELRNRLDRLKKATTDKERALILENYKGNQQEMEDVLELLTTSLKNFEDSYRAGGPDLVPTRLGQKILKATVGSVLAKVEIAIRNLSQGQLQVFTNLRAMNYMSARLAAWKALSNVPRGMINTSYMVARNIAGFADRRLGRDPQFQRTLKGAVDVVADGIFKTAQAALFKPMVGAENVRKSFERVFNLGFDTSGDSWDTIKQAWIDSGQFRNQIEQDEAMKTRTSRAINLLDRLANTALDSVNAVVRGSVLESSDTGMNALSLGLVGNMEQRLEEVAMVFGKRLTDLGITRIDPTDKRAVLQANEWLPSLNQQTAANSLGEIRKFLESSASSEGFSLEQNLLQYYQDKMAGKPAEIFNQRTFDAVQRSMIAENNAALPTNRASAGQASTLWRTLLTLQGYPADAFLKMMRIATGGTRDRKAVLQAASKISLALGVAALAIIVQGSGDAGAELWKRKMQGKRADRPTPLDADFYTDPDHLKRAMGNYLLLSSYYVGDIIRGAYGWVDGRSTIDPLQKAFALATASQIARDISSGVKIAMKGGATAEVLEPLRKSITRLTFGAPEIEQLLGKERDNTEAARRGITENAKAKGFDLPAPGFGGTVGLTNVKRKALSQAVSDMDIAKRKGDTEGYNKAKAAAQKQIAELEAYYLKQRLEAGDSPEVAAKTAKASAWGDYQENNPVTAALGGKRPTAEQYKQLVESSTGERGEVIRQGIKAWQDGAQALFGKPGNITKEDVAENRPGGTVREPSYGRVSLTGGVSGRMKSVGTVSSRGRRAKIRRVSLTGRRRKIGPMRSRRKKIRRVRLTA